MKRIIYLIIMLLLINCSHKNRYEEICTTYQLKTKHFVSGILTEHSFGFNTGTESVKYKFVDTHIAWLEYSNGNKTKYFTYDVTHSVDYTSTLKHHNAKELLGQTFIYDNGFQIDELNLIEFYSDI